MNGNDLFKALSELDADLILEAEQPAPTRRKHSPRRFSAVLIAAAVVGALALTASATEPGGGWFRRFFADQAGQPLTEAQIAYLDEHAQAAPQSQTHDGYTITLKTALTDGVAAYIVLGITGPEDAVLDKTAIQGYYSTDAPRLAPADVSTLLTDDSGAPVHSSIGVEPREDGDGLANTQDVVIRANSSSGQFAEDMVWTLRWENLIARYFNEDYYRSTWSRENRVLDASDDDQIAPSVPLAEGVWEFSVSFSQADTRQLELVQTPVACTATVGWDEDERHTREVHITSFTLRALSAAVETDCAPYTPDLGQMQVVMGDGSAVALRVHAGGPGRQDLRPESPIILDQVACVQLADGTKLEAP